MSLAFVFVVGVCSCLLFFVVVRHCCLSLLFGVVCCFGLLLFCLLFVGACVSFVGRRCVLLVCVVVVFHCVDCWLLVVSGVVG